MLMKYVQFQPKIIAKLFRQQVIPLLIKKPPNQHNKHAEKRVRNVQTDTSDPSSNILGKDTLQAAC